MNHEGHQEHKGHEGLAPRLEHLAGVLIDAGLKVHRAFGSGLLESAYEHCLAHELGLRGVSFRRQVPLPIVYDGVTFEAGYRIDILVEDEIIIEVKATEAMTRLHEAQLLTYLKLSGKRLGLLMNFNVELFKNGLRRRVP